MYFVYMLLSLDNFKNTYVGYTKNLSGRLKLHNSGKGAKYTKGRSWKIIYSNNDADIYETNLMRRLTGLLYIDDKIMGDIKDKIKKKNSE